MTVGVIRILISTLELLSLRSEITFYCYAVLLVINILLELFFNEYFAILRNILQGIKCTKYSIEC